MRDTIFIRMKSVLDKNVEWIVRGKTGFKKPKIGTLAEAARACGTRRIVLIIPSDNVLLTQAEVPTRNRSRILAAIPFALEEYLIEDIESQHFASNIQKQGTQHPVAVINKKLLEDWLSHLRQSCGIKPEVLVPDILCIPQQEGWNAIMTQSHCYIRTGRFSGFSCTPDQFLNHMTVALNYYKDQPPTFFNCWCNPRDINNHIIEFFVKHQIKLNFEKPDKTLISLFASQYHDNTVINLLQGSYSQNKSRTELWRKWYPAAAALIIWLGLSVCYRVIDYVKINNEVKQLRAQTLQLYKETFPQARRFDRLRKRMESRLIKLKRKQGVSRYSFMEILGATGDAIKNIKSFELTKLRFEHSELSIYFLIDDTSKIDQIEQTLRRHGLSVSRGPSNRAQDKFSSNLTISGGRT